MANREEPLAESLGERLRRLREKKGLSTTQLAHAANVSEAAVKKIEAGGSNSPSFQTGVLMARALGVTCDILAFGLESPLTLPTHRADEKESTHLAERRQTMDRWMARLEKTVLENGRLVDSVIQRLDALEKVVPAKRRARKSGRRSA